MPRASSRPTYRRREEKKEKEISPAPKIERFLLFRGGGGGRRKSRGKAIDRQVGWVVRP